MEKLQQLGYVRYELDEDTKNGEYVYHKGETEEEYLDYDRALYLGWRKQQGSRRMRIGKMNWSSLLTVWTMRRYLSVWTAICDIYHSVQA